MSRVPRRDVVGDPHFWVHQFKLIEGIDDPRFRVLAVFAPLRNERAFVQQVGRILRNPGRGSGEEAVVFAHRDHALAESWDAYRRYDRAATVESLSRGPKSFARELPTSQYIDGRFREPFDLDAPDAHQQFDYPLAARVYERPPGLTVDHLEDKVEAEWLERDRELGIVARPDGEPESTPTCPSTTRRSCCAARSPNTRSDSRCTGSLTTSSSTTRKAPTPSPLADAKSVDATLLQTLFRGQDARLTSVALTNTDLSRYATRRRVIDALSVADLAPDVGDRAHFPTIATGRTEASGPVAQPLVTRYVGLGTGRIRDRVARTSPYGEYVEWVDEMARLLAQTGARPLRAFDRYARVTATPAATTPESILLDFDATEFQRTDGDGPTLEIDELCLPVTDRHFTCVVNDTEYEVRILWNAANERYELSSERLDTRYTRQDASLPGGSETLIVHLNRNQAFRIVPRQTASSYLVYTSGVFVDPRLPLGPDAATAGGLDLLQILSPVSRLSTIGSEKGGVGTATRDGWHEDSLFGLMDRSAPGTEMAQDLEALDLLVCDDLGTEIADFIGVDRERRRVVAIHAKSNRNPRPLSASALHEVTAQAVKNLAYLQPYFASDPPNLARWDQTWRDGRAGTVDRRVRRGGADGAAAWQEIRNVVRDPAATREAWLVIGQGLSKEALAAEQVQTAPSPETVQILYSLQATWSALAAVGCRLRVFCSA